MFKAKKLPQLGIATLCLLVIAASLLIILLPMRTNNVANAADLSLKANRLLYFIDKNVEGMNSEYKTDSAISTTKKLSDFAGNTYMLIECDPTGYMIMCDDSATMVEYSGVSPSPYTGLTDNLYYGGPSFFYVCENGKYRHTITNEVFDFNPGIQTNSAVSNDSVAQISEKMHKDLMADSNKDALDYIETGIMPNTEIADYYGETWTCVNHMLFFANKREYKDMGYKYDGYCGYIAAGMLIGYYDTFIRECMDDGWLYMSGSGVNRNFTGSGLVDRLFNQFSKGKKSSTSTVIRETMNKYFKYYGYKLGSYDMITPFFSGATLKNLIENNTPSILFGNLGYATDPTKGTGEKGDAHAVVIYGYKKGGVTGTLYSFLAHYGWKDYSTSTINYRSYSVFGSMYRITLK